MKKFWNWIHDDSGDRVLRLEGPIDSESFWGTEITPQMFRDELYAEEGDITLWINSPGGNVFAAAEIYTMIRDYPGSVTVRIASIAASAASVVAMAGDVVQMSPTALLMLHDPSTIAMGNAKDMEKVIDTLDKVKESIITAYAFKTGLSHNRLSKLMSDVTWLPAKKAVELGFADEILFEDKSKPEPEEEPDKEENGSEEKEKKPLKLEGSNALWQYSTRIMGETILNRCGFYDKAEDGKPQTGTESPEQPEAVVIPTVEDSPKSTAEESEQPQTGAETPDRSEAEVTNTEPTSPVVDKSGQPPAETQIVIGMDGKTKDGAMPYEILKDKLEWMR